VRPHDAVDLLQVRGELAVRAPAEDVHPAVRRRFIRYAARTLRVSVEAVPVHRDEDPGSHPARKVHGLAAVEVADDAVLLPEVVATIDGEERDLDLLALERLDERIAHDRVTCVVQDEVRSANDEADEAASTVAVGVLRGDAVDGWHDVDAQGPDVDGVPRLHHGGRQDAFGLGGDGLGQDEPRSWARLREFVQKGEVEVVEMFVRDEDSVDRLVEELEGWRRDQACLVPARPRVDEDARAS
jgi:hypothetical protein